MPKIAYAKRVLKWSVIAEVQFKGQNSAGSLNFLPGKFVVMATTCSIHAKKMSSTDVLQRLQQSFAALKQYFSLSRKQEGIGNVAQLVLFAEHAAKVFILIKTHHYTTMLVTCTEWV